MQSPHDHLKAKIGCPSCANVKKLNTNEFIKIANEIHNNKYEYTKTIYLNIDKSVIITCKVHGDFEQIPYVHIRVKCGCPKCSHIVSKPETEWLNYVGIPNDKNHRQVKFKINNKLVKIDGFDSETNTVYEFYGDFWHGNPNRYSADGYNTTAKKTFAELYNKTIERENLIKSAGYNFVSIWESDWYKLKHNLATS